MEVLATRTKWRIGFANPAISSRIQQQNPGCIAVTGPAAEPGHWNAFGEVKALVYHPTDAAMVGAAPTMLEALEAAYVALLKTSTAKSRMAFEMAMVRDAIAEATGMDPD